MDRAATARRRWLLIGGLAAIIVVALVAWAIASAGSAPAPAATASASSSGGSDPAASAEPTVDPTSLPEGPVVTPAAPEATGAPPASDAPIAPEAAPVAPTEAAEQAGVRVELVRTERVEGVAQAPGEISGPAVRITVRITNDGDEPLNAGLVAVNAYYGAARSPASPIMQPGGDPFDGSIAPGASAEGVYLFEGDDAELADALIGVDAVPGQPTFTFRGDLR